MLGSCRKKREANNGAEILGEVEEKPRREEESEQSQKAAAKLRTTVFAIHER